MPRHDPRTTTQRGYGYAHKKARREALDRLIDGLPCARCGRPMYRSQARVLDLDHTDDRRAYNGLAHRSCNTRAGQAKAMRNRRPQPEPPSEPTIHSRRW
jgi:hypothetical protein